MASYMFADTLYSVILQMYHYYKVQMYGVWEFSNQTKYKRKTYILLTCS